MKFSTIACLITVLLLGCTKDRIFEIDVPDGNSQPPIDSFNVIGSLMINEVVSSGATLVSELGPGGDWFEIYNPKTSACTLEAGKWFITDNLTEPEKYELPAITVNALSHLIIFCDDSNTVLTQIHTNFKLSSAGDKLGIIYKSSSATILVDTVTFGPQSNNEASARIPDGSANWLFPVVPTPGEPNQ